MFIIRYMKSFITMSGDNSLFECYKAPSHSNNIDISTNSVIEDFYSLSACNEKCVVSAEHSSVNNDFECKSLDKTAYFRLEALPKVSSICDMDCISDISHNSADVDSKDSSSRDFFDQTENQNSVYHEKDLIQLSPETTNYLHCINNNIECKSVKHAQVTCLESVQKLKKTCENQKVKFNDFSADSNLTIILEDNQKRDIYFKKCSVKCLQSIEDLNETCSNLGLKLNDMCSTALYEVDMIIGAKVERGGKKYLIKWLNYDMDNCTWEPETHLVGCKELIEYYETVRSSSSKLNKKTLHYFVHQLNTRKPYDILTLTKLCALISGSSEALVAQLNLSISQLKVKAKELLNVSDHQLRKISKALLNIMLFYESRKTVLARIKEWQVKINSFNPAAFIEVQNDVDLEPPPTDFQFIHDYIASGIDICKEPVAFCHCDNCFENRHSCCPKDSDGHFAYDKYGRLQLPPGYPIYECNKLCKCPMTCINRVVQHGQKVKVAIFRTSNGCGWGLKTLEAIHKGQFVLEYLGEIITSEAAEARGAIYDFVGRSYLFDLDYGIENCTYTVDAGPVGNAAHFINHSCNPNLHVFAVWINQPDPDLPRLAFFAKRNIRRGEELTFDYKMLKNCKSSPNPSRVRVLCKCNSRNCKKYLC